MTLGLQALAAALVAALLYAALIRGRARGWVLLALSVVTVYWLQPRLPIRFSDFLLPSLLLLLTVSGWALTRSPDEAERRATRRDDRLTLLTIGVIVLLLALNRYLPAAYRLTPSRPPDVRYVLLGLGVAAALIGLLTVSLRRGASRRQLSALILLLTGLFVVVKAEPLAGQVSYAWRWAAGQDLALAGIVDLNWLGFSYVAFRLIHTARDRQTGVLPALSLREYVTYVVFFPSFIAGPIDRAERFALDYRALPGLKGLDGQRFMLAGYRIASGLLKKFVIADTLAQGMALDALNVSQATSTAGLWLLLYGYAFRLYFDFAGYTDIAIGIGMLFGVRLPENFSRPYFATNITSFWQSWHITLSNWARFYIFTPLSRALLRRKPRPAPSLILLISHISTMAVIGLWHGVSWHFLIWGLWHAAALFAHKQWSDRTRAWYRGLGASPGRKRAWSLLTWFLTFQYVVIGWVWFVVPDVRLAAKTVARLFGLGW